MIYVLLLLFSEQQPLNLTHTTSFVVFPQDCNANPPMVFGGKILSEMDRCAGVTTRRLLYASSVKDAVTVAVKDVSFHRAGEVKDLLFVTGTVTELGKKSVTIKVKVEKEVLVQAGVEEGMPKRVLLAEGTFIFVAFDLNTGQAVEHGLKLPEE